MSHSSENQQSMMSNGHMIATHIDHDVIHINGNTDFLSTANVEGWPGNGSATNPIIISGYSFSAAEHMFRLQNTDLHFRFCNNMLDGIRGVWCGMAVMSVKNGEISNNTVVRAAVGIHVVQVKNINITSNVIHDNFLFGIFVEDGSKNVIVSENIVYNHPEEGIYLDNPVEEVSDTVDSVITRNTVYSNGKDGILLGRSDNVNVTDNVIHSNLLNGITAASGNHIISGNEIFNNRRGIQISSGSNSVVFNSLENNKLGICVASSFNFLTQNWVSNCSGNGIRLHSVSSGNSNGSDNSILNNTIVNCTDYGLEISSACISNVVKWNNFFNNSDKCQVQDDGINNEVFQNFYNDWIEPDSDIDGFVDKAYLFDGDAENSDIQPLAHPCQPVPEWCTITIISSPTTTTSTTTDLPPLNLDITLVGGAIIAVVLIIAILLKKRSG